jgi:hypothetical protein
MAAVIYRIIFGKFPVITGKIWKKSMIYTFTHKRLFLKMAIKHREQGELFRKTEKIKYFGHKTVILQLDTSGDPSPNVRVKNTRGT